MKTIITIVVLMIAMSAGAQKAMKPNIGGSGMTNTKIQPPDTTAKPPVYVLLGDKQSFLLLLTAIDKPDEMKRGDIEKLRNWVGSARTLAKDTTGHK